MLLSQLFTKILSQHVVYRVTTLNSTVAFSIVSAISEEQQYTDTAL